ncbi:sporulation protein [Anoxybacillus rupiensis]|jgi:sporulation-control protein|uniref:Sporulation protein n=1 Tax=Anoxybacteroides rupiense TaxID=311460 RepID=A0ABD5IZ34_9BACL|nr:MULTISPECIES: sporulation protein [Anoxybacillus]KXG10714.1 Sporulation-control protein spo0M [Anoxybacillus sp. P3H1B]MBB3905995.1 sporulation-control protein spo0M [Anoxybacillus rupiensis]MBS2772853.1 sporulation protein [Anoxybacillus rupiensis]MDE8563279.1 sporulation protein [Anoxybacillus rupiensis]MED5053632.1 sporulation protein [Anoxybacillus rupiensis]
MLLRKMMSKLGVGSAYVDLLLNKNILHPGDVIEGQLYIRGGTVEQKIKKLDVDFVCKMLRDGKEEDTVIATIPIAGEFIIKEEQKKFLPFSYQIPEDILPSQLGVSYRFITRLHIEDAIDTLDFDYIQIVKK